LAHDVGQALGCGAHLSSLVRTRSGPFSLDDAITLDALEAASESGEWEQVLLATDRAVETLPAAILGEEHSTATRHGRRLNLDARPRYDSARESRPSCRAYSLDGEFLGLLEPEAPDTWKPSKVFVAQ
jgi:tRNA pseudouridine55 synthase